MRLPAWSQQYGQDASRVPAESVSRAWVRRSRGSRAQLVLNPVRSPVRVRISVVSLPAGFPQLRVGAVEVPGDRRVHGHGVRRTGRRVVQNSSWRILGVNSRQPTTVARRTRVASGRTRTA
ncbi:hypothetical protein [Streptomyces glaucus]|uniref:Secreted protein n=1 Tax=Streptomyces glaucus TaxID=284029 RepID=A0ABN3JMA2_9ACTN